MRQILSRSVLTVAAAGSILAAAGGYANADSDVQGGAAGSPGVLSGNSVSAPIDVPVNACGNTVNAVAADNPAFGNSCANVSQGHYSGHTHGSGPGAGSAVDSGGKNTAEGSPGVLSGNSVDIPVHVPVNACGNSVDAAAALNPAFGNSCANSGEGSSVAGPPQVREPQSPPRTTPRRPPRHDAGEPPAAQVHAPRSHEAPPVVAVHDGPRLADTGVDGRAIGAVGTTSAALLLGGAMLYRRGTRTGTARIR